MDVPLPPVALGMVHSIPPDTLLAISAKLDPFSLQPISLVYEI